VSTLGYIGLIFVDPGVKVDGAYHYDLLMPPYLLPQVCHNVVTLVYRSLSGNSASYLADDCRLVADARERQLRSTESLTCVVTRTHSNFGDRDFAAAGRGLWNSLPPHLRDADLPYSRFRRSLKSKDILFV